MLFKHTTSKIIIENLYSNATKRYNSVYSVDDNETFKNLTRFVMCALHTHNNLPPCYYIHVVGLKILCAIFLSVEKHLNSG